MEELIYVLEVFYCYVVAVEAEGRLIRQQYIIAIRTDPDLTLRCIFFKQGHYFPVSQSIGRLRQIQIEALVVIGYLVEYSQELARALLVLKNVKTIQWNLEIVTRVRFESAVSRLAGRIDIG